MFEGFPEPKSPEVVVLAPPTQSAPLPTPQVYLQYIYDEDDWEDFTVEWVHQFGTWAGRPYIRVQRMGGAGDRGADVAACLSEQGTAGEWHCYQCKHYLKPIGQSDAFPEMVKIFVAKILGTYELPTRYVFVAPKVGTGLERLLLNPPQLKEEFFTAWNAKDSKLGQKPKLSPEMRTAVGDLAQATDFSMFEARNLDEILDLHAVTPHHVRRFPQPLKARPAADPAPPDQAPHEAVYVRKLLDAYNAKHGIALETLQQARDHAKVSGHLFRQRAAFFHAESLWRFAQESVPEATYTAIETDLYDAVIEIEDRDHASGYARLEAVLDAAVAHTPNPANILAPVVKVIDLKGMCHRLANDDRLTWCKEETP
ncbi:ABC-three component system protein [Streptomyces iakyrus]|uniref:ABC-three component system protein n=1 Tax=Streptomyces iakyrus TaxID=68219 RepID=UPI003D93F999